MILWLDGTLMGATIGCQPERLIWVGIKDCAG